MSKTLNAFSQNSKTRSYSVLPRSPSFDELCDTADEELFSKAVKQSHHVLHTLLPPPVHHPPHHIEL